MPVGCLSGAIRWPHFFICIFGLKRKIGMLRTKKGAIFDIDRTVGVLYILDFKTLMNHPISHANRERGSDQWPWELPSRVEGDFLFVSISILGKNLEVGSEGELDIPQ